MKLGLTFHFKSLEQISPWISKCKELRSLKLRSIDEFSRPSELKLESMNKHDRLSELYLLGKLSQKIEHLQLPKNLKMVTLSVSNLTEDPMQTLGELPQLKILRLFARSYIGKEMTCKAKGFPELRVLKLWMLEELEKWIVQEGSMLRLRELEIRRCDKLKETSGWQQLNSLKELILTNMSEDFVAEMESTMKERNVKITKNNWKFDPLPSYLSEGQS
ncbi:hypothetical protein JCGZ_04275 [Jatropha curcas]|uniref:Disease resistance R13L4/SHOC-2-like LRR domain-containing protein n=2 Tax=Jatropha curcas TaxID=180498 RepID=A0A067L1I9_JATCU|nr:hypothetical protein JCGZ_04275 [Jatropha curcas]